jgi:hypothetical protein
LTGARRKEVDDDGGVEGGVCREGGKEEAVEEQSLLARWKERERGRDGWESTGVEEGGQRRLRVAPGLRLDLAPYPGLVVLQLQRRVGRGHLQQERGGRRLVGAVVV